MTMFTTKHSIGDKVFYATTSTTQQSHPCPDCLGTKEWDTTSPVGGQYKFPCPRCSGAYLSNGDMTLQYTAHVGQITSLTIGSVRTDTERNSADYMCEETGVGSGTIYTESVLFSSEEQAQEVADVMATERNTGVDWIAKQYNKSLKVCDYQLTNAEIETSRAARIKQQANVQGLFSQITYCSTLEEVRKTIDEFKWDK